MTRLFNPRPSGGVGPGGGVPQEFSFVSNDWTTGTPDTMFIKKSPAVLVPGDIGQHTFSNTNTFLYTLYENTGGTSFVHDDVQFSVDVSTGTIKISKSPLSPNFDGRVIIEGV